MAMRVRARREVTRDAWRTRLLVTRHAHSFYPDLFTGLAFFVIDFRAWFGFH